MAKSMNGLTTRKATKKKRIRKFGFITRMQKWHGRNILKRRRTKKRAKLSASNDFGTSKMEKDKKFSRRK
jgi:ribosomal protein L34